MKNNGRKQSKPFDDGFKECNKCLEAKPATFEFYSLRTHKKGKEIKASGYVFKHDVIRLRGVCRVCDNERIRQRRIRKGEIGIGRSDIVKKDPKQINKEQYLKHRERKLAMNKEYRKTERGRENMLESGKKRYYKAKENLSDYYIKGLLAGQGVKRKDCTPELIEVYRKKIILSKEGIKSNKNFHL